MQSKLAAYSTVLIITFFLMPTDKKKTSLFVDKKKIKDVISVSTTTFGFMSKTDKDFIDSIPDDYIKSIDYSEDGIEFKNGNDVVIDKLWMMTPYYFNVVAYRTDDYYFCGTNVNCRDHSDPDRLKTSLIDNYVINIIDSRYLPYFNAVFIKINSSNQYTIQQQNNCLSSTEYTDVYSIRDTDTGTVTITTETESLTFSITLTEGVGTMEPQANSYK